MNGALLHLGLNHFPVILVSVGVGFVFLGWVLKREFLWKTGLSLFVVAGLFGVPAYFSGEPAEHVIETQLSGAKHLIHEHEEWAEKTIVIVVLLSFMSSVFLLALAKGKKIVKPLWAILGLLSLLTCFALMKTAHYGGLIHHEEIRLGN